MDKDSGDGGFSRWQRQAGRCCLALVGICLLGLAMGIVIKATFLTKLCGTLLAATCALGVGTIGSLRGYQFTCWIVTAFVAAMAFPERFLHVGSFDLRHPWLILGVVQLVMFGMGTQMRLTDIAHIVDSPHAIAVGLFCQFTVMPLLGITLAKLFGLPPEIAAGVVLIGSCSSGLASNVMVYMAKGNLALSVTLTAVATLMAPLITPWWMQKLAGQMIEVSFAKMSLTIIKIVIVPIGAALVHDLFGRIGPTGKRRVMASGVLGFGWILCLVFWHLRFGLPPSTADVLILSGFLFGAIVFGLCYQLLVRGWPVIQKSMPVLSMVGIVYFTLVTTAAGRDDLLKVGVWLFFVAVLHNSLGYFFGYALSRLLGLDDLSARTVALEVGLQNGGMASGLAGAMGKLATVGLAPAIFSPWMNVSGSLLANYWKRRQFPNLKTKERVKNKFPNSFNGV